LLPLVYHSTFCQSSSHFFSCLEQERKGKREIKSGKILCSFDLNRKHYCFVLLLFSSLAMMMTANIIFHKRLEYFYTLFFIHRHSSLLSSFTFYYRKLRVVRKLRYALGGRRVEEFVTAQKQIFLFFGKFMTRDGGGLKCRSFAWRNLRTTPYWNKYFIVRKMKIKNHLPALK